MQVWQELGQAQGQVRAQESVQEQVRVQERVQDQKRARVPVQEREFVGVEQKEEMLANFGLACWRVWGCKNLFEHELDTGVGGRGLIEQVQCGCEQRLVEPVQRLVAQDIVQHSCQAAATTHHTRGAKSYKHTNDMHFIYNAEKQTIL